MEDEADEHTLLLNVKNAEYTDLSSRKEHCRQMVVGEMSDRDKDAIKKLTIVLIIAIIFMIAEMIGGWIANSIAIFSDALHLLSDVAGYLVSIAAIYMANWMANEKMTWGYKRCEILGAVVSVLMIWIITLYLVYEAINRIINRPQVNGMIMFITACLGVIVNITMGIILITGGHGHSHGITNHGHSHGDAGCGLYDEKIVERNYQADGASHHSHSKSPGNHGHSHGKKSTSHGHGKKEVKSKHSHGHGHGKEEAEQCHGHGKKSEPENSHGHSHAKSHGHSHANARGSRSRSWSHGRRSRSLDSHHGHPHGSKPEAEGNINLRAAIVHVVGDLLQSFAVVIAGALIWIDHDTFALADPICTLIFSVLVMYTTYSIMKDVFEVLMMATPQNINLAELQHKIMRTSNLITDVHCLHVWAITKGVNAMTCVITVQSEMKEGVKEPICQQSLLNDVKENVSKHFDITHTCIELDQPDHCIEYDSDQRPVNHRS